MWDMREGQSHSHSWWLLLGWERRDPKLPTRGEKEWGRENEEGIGGPSTLAMGGATIVSRKLRCSHGGRDEHRIFPRCGRIAQKSLQGNSGIAHIVCPLSIVVAK